MVQAFQGVTSVESRLFSLSRVVQLHLTAERYSGSVAGTELQAAPDAVVEPVVGQFVTL